MTALAESLVFMSDARAIQMRQLWHKHTAIFVFLRHFACIACRAHAVQVWADRERYERAGGRIVFVGNGQPHFIEKFREDLKLGQAVIVTDPTLTVFKRVGFHYGFFYVVKPASALNAVKLLVDGHRQTGYSRDAGTHWQLGGVLVVSTAGKPVYRFISESLGDFPEDRSLKFIQKNDGTLKGE